MPQKNRKTFHKIKIQIAYSCYVGLTGKGWEDRGLEQQVALPRDSFLQDYFQDVMSTLRVGPPLMLVVNHLNMSRHSPNVDRVCSTAGCQDDSLLNRVRNKLLPLLHVRFAPNPT